MNAKSSVTKFQKEEIRQFFLHTQWAELELPKVKIAFGLSA